MPLVYIYHRNKISEEIRLHKYTWYSDMLYETLGSLQQH